MKNILHSLSLIITTVCSISAQNTIPNPDFENWTVMSTYNNPDGWDNLNAATSGASVFTCLKGSPGVSGNSYLKLISKPITGFGVVPGIAACGTIDIANRTVTSGYPFSARPQALTGSWQYMASGSDQGFVAVTLTKWNSGTHRRDTVAHTFQPLAGMEMSWVTFNIPLTYRSQAAPDSCVIILSASNAAGNTAASNSYLYVDNLVFTGSVAGITELATKTTVQIYPNPVSGNVLHWTSETELDTKTTVSVSDIQGKQYYISNLGLSGNSGSIPVQNLSAGVYILHIRQNGVEQSIKFVKN